MDPIEQERLRDCERFVANPENGPIARALAREMLQALDDGDEAKLWRLCLTLDDLIHSEQ